MRSEGYNGCLVCMYVCMYVCLYVCMCVCLSVRTCYSGSTRNRPFPARPNYQSVGGVITSGMYWGKKGDVMLRVYT